MDVQHVSFSGELRELWKSKPRNEVGAGSLITFPQPDLWLQFSSEGVQRSAMLLEAWAPYVHVTGENAHLSSGLWGDIGCDGRLAAVEQHRSWISEGSFTISEWREKDKSRHFD